jgi:threonyl-tRNA synthetase
MERMVAHLLEVHNGSLPVWLSPVQAIVVPVSAPAQAQAAHVRDALVRAGLRAVLDDRDATVGARVRDAQKQRAPYIAVVGEREATDGTVSVRLRTAEQLGPMAVERFVALVHAVASERSPGLLPQVAIS